MCDNTDRARIATIHVLAGKGCPPLAADSARLVQNMGMQGDAHWGAPGISFMDDAVNAGPADSEGLCGKKFGANIVTAGLDYACMREGMTLVVGTARLRVGKVGKRCWPECALVQRGAVCALKSRCLFADVVGTGDIHVGDTIDFVLETE